MLFKLASFENKYFFIKILAPDIISADIRMTKHMLFVFLDSVSEHIFRPKGFYACVSTFGIHASFVLGRTNT